MEPPDAGLRKAAAAIYEAVYPTEEWTPVPFADAERLDTVHYRNAVNAARFFQPVEQGTLLLRRTNPAAEEFAR